MPPLRRACFGLVFGAVLVAAPASAANWQAAQAVQLRQLALAAADDALPVPDTAELDAAIAEGRGARLDAVATALALRLARAHMSGVATAEQRAGWRIVDTDSDAGLEDELQRALDAGTLPAFFAARRPVHPDYAALRAAYARETVPARRLAIARNMERWRWMPRDLGDAHVLVNAAAFEARLWRAGRVAGTWPVIVGKVSTPTPVFSARITGVVLNPWWNIPASIVREKRGRFPASQGYVRVGGQWRQKPGPANALGRMRLEMPNPYSVYMHDTPSKQLFARPVRAFSHGCVRTGDALGFAATLLDGRRTRQEIDAIVESGQTVTVDLPSPLPVYIAYFTAVPAGDGTVAILPDVYGRDGRVGMPPGTASGCGG